ncbi:MAG: hypothetical protein DDG60_16095 [Anaerolineae bacterium]|nr:MAG: hypothetical protein DDG60_16095 [Anaerolineae bacterium]
MCRVLILDDNPLYAETLQLILQEEAETYSEIVTCAEDAIEKVTQAVRRGKPYEVLLIDQRLGAGKDGIQVFEELRAISPNSDGILFTGYDDPESGLRAYEAGAFRYLPKTANNREILFVFRALRQWRKEQREHKWQKIFSEMMEASIREQEFHAAAREIVQRSLKLGFARAHLFWVPTGREANQQGLLLGIRCAGEGRIPDFGSRLFPLGEWIDLDLLQPGRFSLSLREAELECVAASMRAHGYQPPLGEVTLLPLFSGERLLGVLMLDYGNTNKFLSEHERGWLEFYARQVSLALEHAALYSQEKKNSREHTAANRIGQEINAEATHRTVEQILEDVRDRIGSVFFHIENFTALLIEEEHGTPQVRLKYRKGKKCTSPRGLRANRLETWFLAHGEPLLLSENITDFARHHRIRLLGELPASWMGIPLRVNGKLIGGLILQSFRQKRLFTKRDLHFLTLIADQVAGAIQNCRSAERERREMERLDVLSRAGFEMLQVARENEGNLWKTALTLATARFGVGFNRAMLFLLVERTSLIGQAGIGTDDKEKAQRDWEHDEQQNYTFSNFLSDLRTRRLKLTDFDTLVQTIEIPLKNRQDAFAHVMQSGNILQLDSVQARTQLPPELTAKITPTACAVLPLFTSKGKVEGVVLVDNKHNRKPILERDLNRLQTVLNYAGLIWETLREREKSENLLNANQEIMSRSGRENLKDTLSLICNAALGLSEADWCIIYPFIEHSQPLAFDVENISYAGELLLSMDTLIKHHPRRGGITMHILSKNCLYFEDVYAPHARLGRKRIGEHSFIQREKVRAMIGMSIRDAFSGAPLGVFYLNFREPRRFSERDIQHAQSFASLAAFAIANTRRMDEQKHRRRLDAALQTAEAINAAVSLDEMLQNVQERLHRFFHETTLCILSYDEEEQALKFAPGALEFYKITNPKYRRVQTFPLAGHSIACAVARKTLHSGQIETLNVPNVHERPEYLGLILETQSELCASLVSTNHQLLGVLALERRELAGFDTDDEALVKTVAQQLSLGFERFKQEQEISFNKTIAAYNAWASDMAHEINEQAGNIQGWAYLIQEHATNHPEIQKYARDIEQSAQTLLLASPRSDQGRTLLALDTALQKFADRICKQKEISLQFSCNAAGVLVQANPLYFERILRHLIRNAERAMRDCDNKQIILRTQVLDENTVEIQIQDFGPGIPDKIRPLLFQTNVTTKGGGGNGLLITRQLVEEMNGRIRLLPPGTQKGATFSIKLPIYKVPTQEETSNELVTTG